MTDPQFQSLLEGNGLLSGLDPLSRTALCMYFHPADFAAGEVLLAAGGGGDRMLLLLSGQVEVRVPAGGDTHAVATLGPDNLLGEVAFFGQDQPRTADVVALDTVRTALLDRATYQTMLASDPGATETLEKLVLDLMLDRVAETNDRMVELVRAHADDPAFRATARMLASRE